jgi:membrane protein DedA with SNARE-associated domain
MRVRHFHAWFMHLPPPLACAALFLILAVEGIGLPGVPFEPFFLASGALILHGRLGYWPVVLSAAAGNVVGNAIGYALALLAGPYIHGFLLRRLRVPAANLAQGERWVRRYGGRALFVGRWFGPVRTPAILVAGMARMPFAHYAAWSALAALSWTATWQFLAWHFGAAAAALWGRFGFSAVGAVLLAAAAAWFGTRALRSERVLRLQEWRAPHVTRAAGSRGAADSGRR